MIASQVLCLSLVVCVPASAEDLEFEQIAARYVDQFPALSPVSATTLGDHRFDSRLDEVSDDARTKAVNLYRALLHQLETIELEKLSRANRVDYALLRNELRSQLWRIEKLQEWAWNPLVYTELSGGAIYGLMAREFAPLQTRLGNVADRLEQFPRLFQQIRGALVAKRVPRIHAEPPSSKIAAY